MARSCAGRGWIKDDLCHAAAYSSTGHLGFGTSIA
jgi:hypothetical protein